MEQAQAMIVIAQDEITPEQLAAIEEEKERLAAERAARLDALGVSLAKKRREAILYRRQSGIEQEWDEDEDAYNGLDEASKAEQSAFRSRPPGQLMMRADDDEVRSTIVLNITKPYVNAFASKIVDMRLRTDDRAWSFTPTPIPELEEQKTQKHLGLVKDGQPIIVNDSGEQRQATVSDLAARAMEKASKAAAAAQKRVDDWLTESCWGAEVRQVIDDMARIGTGVLKGPFPERRVYTVYSNGNLNRIERIEPRSKRVKVRDIFPDPACGENVHDGDFLWERDYLTAKRLRDLKNMGEGSGYIAEQIDAVLAEGPRLPEVEYDPSKPVDQAQASRPYQIWYYYGVLDRDDCEAAGCEVGEEEPSVPVIVAMVNDRVIRASRNPLDNGKFPFDVVPCSRREGHWAGVGIGRDLRTPQRIATGATRAMMENAGLSAKPIIALMQGLLVPADGNTTLYGGKLFVIPSGTDVQEAKNAIWSFQIESRQVENMNIIQFALKQAENVTGLPMILQGQQGQAPDLVGVVEILDRNSSVVANRVAKMFDDNLLEPHIGRYYDWLMQYGEDDSLKGDYTIKVLPPPDVQADKAALVEMAKLIDRREARIDPAKLTSELAKSNRFDASRIQYTEEEWEKIEKAMAKNPPADPRVQAAQVREQGESQREQMRLTFEAEQANLDRQLQSAELSSEERRDLEKQKVLLASLALKLRVQKDLSRTETVSPPTEPAGRAPDGQAFVR